MIREACRFRHFVFAKLSFAAITGAATRDAAVDFDFAAVAERDDALAIFFFFFWLFASRLARTADHRKHFTREDCPKWPPTRRQD